MCKQINALIRVRDLLRTGTFFSWVRGWMGLGWDWRFFRRRRRRRAGPGWLWTNLDGNLVKFGSNVVKDLGLY